MYTTDLLHSACVRLNVNMNFQHATLELSVYSKFLLLGRLFLYIYVFNDFLFVSRKKLYFLGLDIFDTFALTFYVYE